VTTFPVLIILFGWFLLKIVGNLTIRKLIDQVSLSVYSVISGLCCLLLLFLMWSAEDRTVFSPGYTQIMRQTPHLRSGCSGIGMALLAGIAESISYILFFVSALTLLAMLGVIQPNETRVKLFVKRTTEKRGTTPSDRRDPLVEVPKKWPGFQ
jgi:peptidoglycan biosynthesis protein MviN/MurJ (putative lipid II flippase)